MNRQVTFVNAHVTYATAEILDCTTTLASDIAPYGAVTGGELVIREHLKEMRLDASQPRLLDETGEIIPDTHFRSDEDYGEWETSPGYGTYLQAWCLTLGDFHTTDEGSRTCYDMPLIESLFRSGCCRRIGFFERRAREPSLW